MITDAIILAAGKSSRMTLNKLSFKLGEYSLINNTIKVFADNPLISRIFVVTDDENIKNNIISVEKLVFFVNGGSSRTQSVANALKIANGDYILIHDGARPFLSNCLINRVIECMQKNNSAVPVIPLPDSIRKIKNNVLTEFADREQFCLVQTPQGFNGKQLRHAYSLIGDNTYTDDSEVYSIFFNNPFTVEGETSNKKITFDNDIFGINAKVGIGYDLHRLEQGLPLVLGGIDIPHYKGFIAHSDGDVLVHSIMDALLGMSNERDIGIQFPDTQNKYKGISSLILLKEVKNVLDKKNIKINNINSVIIAQKPKLSGFIPKMIAKIADTLKLHHTQISINVTTNEEVGDIGKEDAVAVYTVCSGF